MTGESRPKIDASDELIYKLQYRRKINPVFIPLTRAGFSVTAAFGYYFYSYGFGAISAFLFLWSCGYIYKNHFHYRYSEFEKMPVVQKALKFAFTRREPYLRWKPFRYDIREKIEQEREVSI